MPRITFHVSVPTDPQLQHVVIVGSNQALGDWQPEKGLALSSVGPGQFTGSVEMPAGLVEFKVTRGSWATEEACRDGALALNYQYLLTHDLTLNIEVAHWADLPPWDPALIEGKTIECELDATLLGQNRRVCVWLPPSYMRSDCSRHPVLYLLDGQDTLGALETPQNETLRADHWVRRMAAAGRIPELVLVAVFHREEFGQRDLEMSPQVDGPHLADFIAHDLKPFIDYTFCRDRVLADPQNTGVLGFSLGASLALWMALRHSNEFGKFACLSPSYEDLSADGPDESWIIDQIHADPHFGPDRKIYFDHGTLGGDANAGAYQRRMDEVLRAKGFAEGRDFKVLRAEGAEHNLCAWRARLGAPLEFLFPARPQQDS